ncbi:MAG: hypothetical protein ACTSSH_11745, partial [Candidatus Heimdallarchaeota archaeon]
YFKHNELTSHFNKTEEVFLYENEIAEEIATNNFDFVSDFLTIIDMGMQRQAYYTNEIWMEIGKTSSQEKRQELMDVIGEIWDKNYSRSIETIENTLYRLKNMSGTTNILDKTEDILLDICKTRINAAIVIGKQNPLLVEDYNIGKKDIKQGRYETGFNHINKAYKEADMLMKEQISIQSLSDETEKTENATLPYTMLFFILIMCITVLVLTLFLRQKRN